MSIVNFTIPKVLEKRVAEIMKEKGFASKAEFFRFAAIYFIDIIDKPFVSEEENLEYLTEEISREVREKYRGKKLTSAKEQLADI